MVGEAWTSFAHSTARTSSLTTAVSPPAASAAASRSTRSLLPRGSSPRIVPAVEGVGDPARLEQRPADHRHAADDCLGATPAREDVVLLDAVLERDRELDAVAHVLEPGERRLGVRRLREDDHRRGRLDAVGTPLRAERDELHLVPSLDDHAARGVDRARVLLPRIELDARAALGEPGAVDAAERPGAHDEHTGHRRACRPAARGGRPATIVVSCPTSSCRTSRAPRRRW